VLAIGCSTGGPDALATVLPSLPADLPVPVVVVQHMPPVVTRLLATRLDGQSRVDVAEAEHGMPLVPGRVLIAPGGLHLVVRRQGTAVVAELTEDPPENFCRPAVDVLFRSVAAVYGERTLAAVLTGMGRDGERGSRTIRDAGGEIYVQDDATSVVWGMPGAVAGAGLADKILPLPQVGPALATALMRTGAVAGVGR
jgi:two-component system chemotaxis response regulator CheB